MATGRRRFPYFLLAVLFLLVFALAADAQPLGPGSWEPSLVAALERGPAGSWESLNVTHPNIVRVGERYFMYYTGTSDSTYWRGWGVHQIGVATSDDGIHWTKYSGNPAVTGGADPSVDGTYSNTAAVFHDGTLFRMWYSVQTNGTDTGIALATSPDGFIWSKLGIVMVPGPLEPPGAFSLHPGTVLFDDGIYKMWYHVASWDAWRVAYATSEDGVVWTRHGIVVDRGFEGTLDTVSASFPTVTELGEQYLLLYDGISAPGSTQMVLATSLDGLHWASPEPVNLDGFYPDLALVNGALRTYYTGAIDPWTGHFEIFFATWRPDDPTPPVVSAAIDGTLGENDWYTSDVSVSWSVSDPESDITSSSGCETVDVTEDTDGTTLTCTAASAGGTASASVTIKRDTTPPTVACSATPASLWPANHNLWNVTATATASDANPWTLKGLEILSSEADRGLGSDDVPNDIQGFPLAMITSGQLRAERYGKAGRTYTVSFTVADEAGNTRTCAAAVIVPHDQGNGKGKNR